MFKNYLTIAFRNFIKDGVYSSINVIGLAIGLASAILIFSYVSFQYSYDDFHEKKENIYRSIVFITINGIKEPPQPSTAALMGPWMKNELPEVKDYVRILPSGNSIFSVKDEENVTELSFRENLAYYSEASVFTVFDFKLVHGDVSNILKEPNTIVLSQSSADKLFGKDWVSEKVIGRKIVSTAPNDVKELYVQGVFEDLPENSHIHFDYLISLSTYSKTMDTDHWPLCNMYFLLGEQANSINIGQKMTEFWNERYGEDFKKQLNLDRLEIILQPLQDIQLGSVGFKKEMQARGDKSTVGFMFFLGFLICLVAWANYINITTARSIKRAREIGVRKISGATRYQLVMQFLTESSLINLLALFIGLVIVQVSLPLFSGLTGMKQSPFLFVGLNGYLYFLLFFVLGVTVSGVVPALFLSRVNGINIMKGLFQASGKSSSVRPIMVLSNLMVSFILLLVTLSIYQQYKLLQSRKIGLSIDQKLIVRAPLKNNRDSRPSYDLFRKSINDLGIAASMTASYSLPGDPQGKGDKYYVRMNEEHEEIKAWFPANKVDYDFFQVYDVTFLEGRNFSRDNPADSTSMVVTEKFIYDMGFKDIKSALYQKIKAQTIENIQELTIIGIIENINYYSSKVVEIGHVFHLQQDQIWKGAMPYEYYTLSMDGSEDIPKAIEQIQSSFNTLFPAAPFEYFFLDDRYNVEYKNEQVFGQVFGFFSGLALFVTIIGLFGLISYTTSRKIKEIGIRKVLGASVTGILSLFSKDMIKLALIAIVLGVVPGYLFVESWLEKYPYRIDLEWTLFVVPAVVVVLVTMATVSFIIIRAAQANPVQSLRSE